MPEQRLTYPVKRWDLRDVIVLVLIVVSTLLVGWILTLDKTKYIVVVVQENVDKEVKSYKANSKEKLAEWMTDKLKI
jgi:hypothetical protein